MTLWLTFEKVGYETRQFEGNPKFQNLQSEAEVDAAWESFIKRLYPLDYHESCWYLFLPHAGFIHVESPERYGLLPNKHLMDTENTYMVSFHHQLHCLNSIQAHFVNFVASTENSVHDRKIYMITEMAKRHVEYCFDYVRQGIQCAGDVSVEGPDLVRVPLESPLRGWGVEHQCRTWDALLTWLDDNAAIKVQ